jgi:hypothetical protein
VYYLFSTFLTLPMKLELLHQLWGERELLHTSMPLIHPTFI